MSAPRLRLMLPARAENVAIVRHAVAGLAEAVEMEPPQISDLKTVVTEACMNVTVHAYEGKFGPLEVEAKLDDDDATLSVVVRDRGAGIRPRADGDRHSLRLGLPLIAALSTRFAISGSPDRGTEVTMWMALQRAPETPGDGDEPEHSAQRGDATELTMPADELLAPVLTRVISMFAARADFSVDRLSDAVLLGDAISAQGSDTFVDGVAKIAVDEREGAFEVRVGPLDSGAGERLLGAMHIPEIDASLEALADDVTVEREAEAEHLKLRIARG